MGTVIDCVGNKRRKWYGVELRLPDGPWELLAKFRGKGDAWQYAKHMTERFSINGEVRIV